MNTKFVLGMRGRGKQVVNWRWLRRVYMYADILMQSSLRG